MRLRAFTKIPKECINRLIFFLSWFCLVAGFILLIYQIIIVCTWSFKFPPGSGIRGSSFCLFFSILIFWSWKIMALQLIYRDENRFYMHLLYILGCVMAFVLAVISISMLHRYRVEGRVRREYMEATEKYLENEHKLPPWFGTTIDEKQCCGWYSPLDIGTTFVIPIELKQDEKGMQTVAKCFGNFYITEKTQPDQEHLPKYEIIPQLTSVPNPEYNIGCGDAYKTVARQLCYYTVYLSLVIIILSAVFIGKYITSVMQSANNKLAKVAALEAGGINEDDAYIALTRDDLIGNGKYVDPDASTVVTEETGN